MSDAVEAVLTAYAEQLVADVPARAGRRRRMREELLAHLFAVYDEERAATGDGPAALAAATRRFGAPETLASELGGSVPFLERFVYQYVGRKGVRMWRWLLLVGVVALFVGPGFVMPAVAQFRNNGAEGQVVLTSALLTLGIVLTLAGVGSIVYGVKSYRTRNS